jgi:hypothetical protein
MHMLRGIDVDAVGAGDVVLGRDLHTVDLNVLAVENEEAPRRLVVQVQPGDQDLLRRS